MSPRRLAGLSLVCALAGCAIAPVGYTGASLKDQEDFHVLRMGGGVAYLIDPRTEACVLLYPVLQDQVAVTVSCAKLKRNLPEAAQYVTWDEAPAMVPRQ